MAPIRVARLAGMASSERKLDLLLAVPVVPGWERIVAPTSPLVALIERTTESRFTLTALGSGATATGVVGFAFAAFCLSVARARETLSAAAAARFRAATAFRDSSSAGAGRLTTGTIAAAGAGIARLLAAASGVAAS